MTDGDATIPPGSDPQAPYLVTEALRQRLDLAHHLIGFGRQILVVGGARESGRSAFLAQVVAEAAPEWLIIALDGVRVVTPVDLLRAIIDALDPRAASEEPGYHEGDLSGLRAFVRGRLNLLHAERKRVVLVCDDCDDWTEGHAELLAELAYRHDEVGELRPLVACDHAGPFAEILAASTNTNLPQVIDVPPLTREEAAALLGLHADSDSAAADLGDEVFDGCYARADGMAGAFLREVADSRARHAADGATRGSRVQTTAGVALVVLAAVGLLAIAWFDERAASPEPELIELVVPPRPAAVDVRPAAPAPVPPPATNPRTAVTGDTDTAVSGVAPPGAASETVPDPAPGPAAIETSAGAPERAAPAAPASALAAAEPVPQPALADPSSAAPAAKAPAPVPPQSEPATAPEDPETKGYSRKWVLTHSDQHYVLQLFGSRDPAAAARFIAAHGLDNAATVFELEHEGAPWFIAVTGLYSHRAAARAAAAELPAALAASGAWPRPVASLRK